MLFEYLWIYLGSIICCFSLGINYYHVGVVGSEEGSLLQILVFRGIKRNNLIVFMAWFSREYWLGAGFISEEVLALFMEITIKEEQKSTMLGG